MLNQLLMPLAAVAEAEVFQDDAHDLFRVARGEQARVAIAVALRFDKERPLQQDVEVSGDDLIGLRRVDGIVGQQHDLVAVADPAELGVAWFLELFRMLRANDALDATFGADCGSQFPHDAEGGGDDLLDQCKLRDGLGGLDADSGGAGLQPDFRGVGKWAGVGRLGVNRFRHGDFRVGNELPYFMHHY